MTVLHEMAHLVDPSKITSAQLPIDICITIANIPPLADILDQPLVLPPDGDWKNRDWPLWTLDPQRLSYGFSQSQLLGLARPDLGLLNAENYPAFAMCVTYPDLECVRGLGIAIAKRESVPFQPAPEAVKQIREGRSFLLQEDDEMDIG